MPPFWDGEKYKKEIIIMVMFEPDNLESKDKIYTNVLIVLRLIK